jgi:hypothetical protein
MKQWARGGCAALALAVFALLGAAIPASAVSGEPVPMPNQLPPAGAAGSLTVHLYHTTGMSSILGDDGTQTNRMRGINGVTVEVAPVTGVDVSIWAGWQLVLALVDAFDPTTPGAWGWQGIDVDGTTPGIQSPDVGDTISKVTTGATGEPDGTGGVATFADLPDGLYLVQVSGMPANMVGAMPFLITVPIPSQATRQSDPVWVYAVDVYPKAALETPPVTPTPSVTPTVTPSVTPSPKVTGPPAAGGGGSGPRRLAITGASLGWAIVVGSSLVIIGFTVRRTVATRTR